MEKLLGPTLTAADGGNVPIATALGDAEYVAIYFCAARAR